MIRTLPDIFVDMERVTEQYEYPPTEQMPVTEHIYIYEDGMEFI